MPPQSSEESGFHVARGTLYLLAKALVASAVGAVLYIVIARTFPETSDLGLFQGAQSLISISVVLAGAGLARASIRFISFDIGAGNTTRADMTYPTVFVLGIGLSLVVSTVIFLAGSLIASTFFHDASYTLLVKVSAIDVFLVNMIAYANSLLYTMQRFRTAFIISNINIILKLVISIMMLLQVSSILYVIIAFVLSDTISLILFIYTLYPKLRHRLLPYKEFVKLLQFSSPLYGSSILGFLSKELDVYMLLILSSLSVVGIYGPAVLIGTVLFMTITALDQSLAPYFPRVFGQKGLDSLKQLSKLASRYLFLVYVPLCFLILGSLPDVITLVLGDRYLVSVYPSVIIVFSITFTSMIVIFNNVLLSTGHSRVFLLSNFIALAAQLSVSLLLIPSLEGVGAALARACSYTIQFMVPAMVLRKISGLQYDEIALKVGITGAVIILAILLALDQFLHDSFFLPAKLALAIFSYLIFLRFTRIIVPKDLEIMNNIFGQRGSKLINLVARIVQDDY